MYPAFEMRAVPGAVAVLGLLPLGHADAVQLVERALADNPTLRRRGFPCAGCGRAVAPGRSCGCGPARRDVDPAVDPFSGLAVAAGCEIRSAHRHALPLVLAHLTPRGLLDAEPAAIAAMHRLDPVAVAAAVAAVRRAGPPGVAATSVAGMLAAQAAVLVAQRKAPALLVDLVRDHLPAVAAGDLGAVAAALGVAEPVVAELLTTVRERLRPGLDLGGEPPARPVPDVLVDRTAAGDWRVEVPDSRWFGLAVDRPSATVRADPRASAWLRGHERAARVLVRQIDARAAVLHRVAAAAVAHQAAFLVDGDAAHRDLSRADVAAELGLHPSTVSRAVAGKTLRAPDGRTVALASLFGSAVPVRARIAALCAGRPRSDEQLRAALAAEGVQLARRTVAKYRAALGLPAGRHRS